MKRNLVKSTVRPTSRARNAALVGLLVMLVLALPACGDSASDRAASGEASKDTTSLHSGQGTGKLEPGAYVFDPGRRARALGLGHPPKFQLTVPPGWSSLDGWAVHRGEVYTAPVFVTFWDVDRVYATPCKWRFRMMADPGPSVAGLASTLAKQPLRDATAPTDVTLGGFRGKYLQWSVPNDIAFDEAHPEKALFPGCDKDTFQSWTGAIGWASDRYQQAPGQVDRIWILSVHGARLVIDASYLPTSTARERRELRSVVDSIRFVD